MTPSVRLTGPDESAYLKRLLRIIRAARLNLFFPDVRRISDHIGVLRPEIHGGLYDGVDIDRRTGLPHYTAWIRGQTDVRLAPKMLAELGDARTLEAKAKKSPGTIHEKQRDKQRYYAKIERKQLAELGGMQVALRQIDKGESKAYFSVVFDKLEASGLFVRYTIDLVQSTSAFGETVVDLDGETAKHTDAFAALIYKMASLDAELTFLRLSELGGMRVERVTKGTIGPIFSRWVPASPALAPILESDDDFVASFGHALVAVDVADHRDNDPFPELSAEEAVDAGDRAAARAKHGYHVFKDRKFVVPRARAEALREIVGGVQKRCIIYTL